MPAQFALEVAHELLQYCQLIVCVDWLAAEFCCLVQCLLVNAMCKTAVIQQIFWQILQVGKHLTGHSIILHQKFNIVMEWKTHSNSVIVFKISLHGIIQLMKQADCVSCALKARINR